MSHNVVDLTSDGEKEEREHPDVIDLAVSSDEEAVSSKPSLADAALRKTHSHPRKIQQQARKRKRLQQQEERWRQQEQKRKAEEQRRAAARLPNFVIIEDSSSSEDEEEEDKKSKPLPSGKRAFDMEKNFNYNITQQAAQDMQDRLLQQSAARVRQQQPARKTTSGFTEAVFDIADRYPDHWRWKEPYSVLGLPKNSSVTLVKSQYRRLARRYHPDKSQTATAHKFHAICTAYRKLV